MTASPPLTSLSPRVRITQQTHRVIIDVMCVRAENFSARVIYQNAQ